MATTIKTVMTYPLDGSTTDFNIPFEYLARKFVRVTLIGVDRKELILNQDYRFATKTTISTTRALGPADGYNLIEIRRYTSATERLVDFTDGSILRAYDLNISQVQTLHVAEEARDLTADTIGVNNDGDLDARGRRIVNVADAKDPGDAITLGQVQRWNDSALNSANRAKQEADRATARANDANNSANASASSASSSAGSAELAKRWATSDTAVESGLESSRTYALHSMSYRNEAKGSADRAAVSETNAKDSEVAAAQSAAASQQSNVESKAQADRSKNEADRAKSEADKIQDYNNLVPEVNRINGIVTVLDRKTTNMDFEAGFLTSFSGTNERSQLGLRVDDDWLGFKYNPNRDTLTLEGWKPFSVVEMPELGAKYSYFPGYTHTPAAHITSQADITGVQGLHLQWNAPGQPEPGYSMFSNNKGGGQNGGFVFRALRSDGSESGNKWTMDGYSGGLFINGTSPVCQVRNSVTGSAANYDSDGGIYGNTWKNYGGDGWLLNFLTSGRAVASCAGLYPRLKMWDGIGNDYLSFTIDSTSCGIRWFVSDERHKENIKAIEDAEEITKIIREYKAVSYKFRDWSMGGKSSRFGYTAQDLQRLWPEAVSVMENAEDAIGETTLLPDHNEMIGGIMLMLKSLDARLQRVEANMPTTNTISSARYASLAIEPTTDTLRSAKDVRYDIEPANLSEGFEEYDADDTEAKLKKLHETVASVSKEETK